MKGFTNCVAYVKIILDLRTVIQEVCIMKYRIEHHSGRDRNKVTIHVDVDLLPLLPPLKVKELFYDDDDSEETDDDTPFFINRLLLIDGVNEAYYDRYSIDVWKGDLFSWKTIMPRVIEDLEVTLNRCKKARQVCRRRTSHSRKVPVKS